MLKKIARQSRCFAEPLRFQSTENQGLVIFGWCLMPSHLHMIVRAEGKNTLSDILRDFKKFTSKAIVKQIEDEPESHSEWMMELFAKAGEPLKKIKGTSFGRTVTRLKKYLATLAGARL